MEISLSGSQNQPDSLDRWDEAYSRVESYFVALGIRNKLVLSGLVHRVLQAADQRLNLEENGDPVRLATSEVEMIVLDWFRQVLDLSDSDEDEVHWRGRLALMLLEGGSQHWQRYFLSPGPYADSFVEAMRNAYLQAGPDFQGYPMEPTELDYGPISEFAESNLERLARWPWVRLGLLWGLLAGLFLVLFYWTR